MRRVGARWLLWPSVSAEVEHASLFDHRRFVRKHPSSHWRARNQPTADPSILIVHQGGRNEEGTKQKTNKRIPSGSTLDNNSLTVPYAAAVDSIGPPQTHEATERAISLDSLALWRCAVGVQNGAVQSACGYASIQTSGVNYLIL